MKRRKYFVWLDLLCIHAGDHSASRHRLHTQHHQAARRRWGRTRPTRRSLMGRRLQQITLRIRPSTMLPPHSHPQAPSTTGSSANLRPSTSPGAAAPKTGSDSDLTRDDNSMLALGPRPWSTSPTSSLPDALAAWHRCSELERWLQRGGVVDSWYEKCRVERPFYYGGI